MWSRHWKTRCDSPSGVSASLAAAEACSWVVFAIHLLHASVWQVGEAGDPTAARENVAAAGPASLREDYLSQVQRDSLSRPATACCGPAPLALLPSGEAGRL